jgi:hexosaminidase
MKNQNPGGYVSLTFKNIAASLLLLILPTSTFAQITQKNVDSFAGNANLIFEVQDNLISDFDGHEASIIIENQSDVALTRGKGNWQIYFHYIRLIDKATIKGLIIEHVNGDLYRISPTKAFEGLKINESISLTLRASNWVVSYSDFMPGAFIVVNQTGGLSKAATFTNTITGNPSDYIRPFKTEKQLLRYNTPKDLIPIANAQSRYENNIQAKQLVQYELSTEKAQKAIIPTPLTVKQSRKATELNQGWAISFSGRLVNEGKFLSEALKASSGLMLTAQANHIEQKDKRLIEISVNPDILDGQPESYTLDIKKDKIRIVGTDNAGAFYGVQSLLALIPSRQANSITLPLTSIKDIPRYNWRGMHYDMARNFHSKKVTLQLIEQMGRYKLNKLHLHLTDDEGWRIEIPDLPELTDVGAKRCFDISEQNCLLTQLGTGSSAEGTGNGYYTKQDFVEIIKYAAQRHIEIIPEIDMPGHARAAIKSMEARYNTLMAQGESEKAKTYLLSDSDDQSEYVTVQNYNDNSINVCLDSTYLFIDKVVYELQQMYREAGLNMVKFHVGGDEVGKGSWSASPACQLLFNKPDNGVAGAIDLKSYFTARVANILTNRQITMGVWEDGIMSDAITPFNRKQYGENKVTVNAWDNIWEFGVADRAYRLANEDYNVVLSSGTHLYFDHPQEAHPQEAGFYWASRFINTRKVFGFMPDNLYANADTMRNGTPIVNLEADVGRELVSLEKPDNILGMQGQIWSETIRTSSQLNTMIYPRMIAMAERAWHKADWENTQDIKLRDKSWTKFSSILGLKEFRRLEADDVEYYLPIPGGIINNGKLDANIAIPGVKIQYSLDNGENWLDYIKRVAVKGPVLLRSQANNGRSSRATKVDFDNQ